MSRRTENFIGILMVLVIAVAITLLIDYRFA